MIQTLLTKIGAIVLTIALGVGSLLGANPGQRFGSPATVPIVVSLFETSLASSIGTTDTSMTLVSGTDRAGTSIAGYMCFVLDSGTSTAEFVCGTASGTSITAMVRGIDPQNPNTTVVALEYSHRRGADVKITDFPQLAILSRLINGTDTFPNVLSYTTHPTFNANTQLADKQYVDGVAVAGAPNSSTTVKGIVQEATVAQVNAGTSAGSTGAILFASPADLSSSIYGVQLPTAGQKNALVGDDTTIAVGSGNLYITQTGLQNSLENYAASTGSANAYVLTVAPVPTAYATGQVFRFKANFTNTASATLNVNALGAKTIKKVDGATNLAAGDITSGQLVAVVYDGTNLQMTSPVGTAPITSIVHKVGTTTYDVSTASGTQNIAHGLGAIPKKVKITAVISGTSAGTGVVSTTGGGFGYQSVGVWDGTNTVSYSVNRDGGANAQNTTISTTQMIRYADSATNAATATITADATNIILTWTKTSTPAGTITLIWEADSQ